MWLAVVLVVALVALAVLASTIWDRLHPPNPSPDPQPEDAEPTPIIDIGGG